MKRIKNAVPGTTINDVAMAVVSGALRLYLTAKDELPDDSLVAMVPISTRTPEQASTGGNQISGMRARLFTDIADPLARLKAVADETRASKEVAAGVRAATLLEVANLMPGALLGAGLRVGGLLPNAPIVANTVVTNTLGPTEPLFFCGARLVKSAGAGPLTDGIGLMHLVSSYVDQFIVNVCADRAMLPDPAFYAECLERSFSELAAAA
jgi:WS/DGAT/MGAT family acyltransferase